MAAGYGSILAFTPRTLSRSSSERQEVFFLNDFCPRGSRSSSRICDFKFAGRADGAA
jgi:hypothetical protein